MKDEEIINLIIRHLCGLPFNNNSVRWNILKKSIGITVDTETTERIFNTLEAGNIFKIEFESNNSFGRYDHPISLVNPDSTMIGLFIKEYKDSNFFPIHKDLPTEILNGFNKCKAAGLIQKRNKFDFEWTEKGFEAKKFNSYQEYIDKHKETAKTNIINVTNSTIGQVNQDSNFSSSPNKIKTQAAPINKPGKKSLLKKIYSSPWTIGLVLLIIEEVTFKNLYKYIISFF